MGRQPAGSGPIEFTRGGRASAEFQARVRARFLGGADAKLEDWTPESPRAEFRARLKDSFLAVEPTPVVVRRAPRVVHTRPTRTRWAAAGVFLAAAAAVLLFLRRGPEPIETVTGDERAVDARSVAAAESPGWSLDASSGDEATLLASVLVDGQAVASLADFVARMASAQRVESLDRAIRIRHEDSFVLELAADSVVRMDGWTDAPKAGQAQVLYLDLGGVRVATGPGFDAASPLVVETAHVRAEVMGTIFGVDVGSDYSCVCCLEGSVRTTALHGEHPSITIGSERTRVVLQDEQGLPMEAPLVEGHRDPLERLVGYWA
ncbi:FecR protein [Planctomycetes bacterium Poly30]|uniref:FecR protein n=1 Tax=Saltatorellus ferox TaxID=2528018 RepID=A0A518EQ41_9BACT|nr:FecR protein [Planctomycetes bacterium Poly30]